jgi:hypothetical protein
VEEAQSQHELRSLRTFFRHSALVAFGQGVCIISDCDALLSPYNDVFPTNHKQVSVSSLGQLVDDIDILHFWFHRTHNGNAFCEDSTNIASTTARFQICLGVVLVRIDSTVILDVYRGRCVPRSRVVTHPDAPKELPDLNGISELPSKKSLMKPRETVKAYS